MRIYDNTEFFGYLFIKSKFIDRLYITSDFSFVLFYTITYSRNNKITDKGADHLAPLSVVLFIYFISPFSLSSGLSSYPFLALAEKPFPPLSAVSTPRSPLSSPRSAP